MYYCKTSNISKIKSGKVVEISSINENGYFVEGNEVSTFLMVNLERIKRYTTIKCLSNWYSSLFKVLQFVLNIFLVLYNF